MVEQSFVAYRNEVNGVLDLHDIGYQVVGTEVIERESMALHADVIEPALALLHGDSRLAGTERAFQDALRESSSPEETPQMRSRMQPPPSRICSSPSVPTGTL